MALTNAQLLESLQRETARLETILQVGVDLSGDLPLEEVFARVTGQLKGLFRFDAATVSLLDEDGETLHFYLVAGDMPEHDKQIKRTIHNSACGSVIQTGKPLIRRDLTGEASFEFDRYSLESGRRAQVFVPMIVHGRAIGTLYLGSNEPDLYDEEDAQLLQEIANQVGAAIVNAQLLDAERARRQRLATVARLARQLTAILDAERLLQETTALIAEAFDYELVTILTAEPGADELALRAAAGSRAAKIPAGYRQAIDTGMIGRAFHTGQTQWANDTRTNSDFIPGHFPQARSEIDVPLKFGDRVAGVLNVESVQLNAFDREDVLTLEALADQLAIALENARLFETEQSQRQELGALYGLSRQLVATDEMEAVLGSIAHHAVESVHATFCRVLILEDDAFICRAAHPIRVLDHDLCVGRSEPPPTWPHYQRALAQKEPVVLRQDDPALSSGERQALLLEVAQSLCLAPLRVGDEAIGLMALGEARTPTREPFDADKLRLVASIADQAASAIHRARLHEELETFYIETVLALAKAMDARDAYTGDHSQRLAARAEATARELGLDEEEIRSIRWAALLHDIGKIGVPDEILLKPDKLNEEEWAVIERHPEIGAEIVASVKKLANVAPIIRAHQEHWNGNGCPDSLEGEAIPLGARVLAVVDAYGAITEERPYKEARSHKEAVAELKRCAGTQFDPRVVEAFLRVLGGEK